ncbi:hypothetical protein ES319_A05G134600v1 [Gossypium barbadense]|uniref:Kinesin motor domain-containing protein n=1 Tax=Gossypium barbadense TaxID=3634 RepID=A0A5J5VNV5_GOSBA|nr:hypothetical protein ES319_A05G134600v1 [Gossypium barbadense]
MNGIGRQGQRSTAAGLQRNVRRGSNAGNDFFMEPTTPPFSSLPSSQRKNGEESPSDFSPGLIDLHSFVTELLPELRKRPLNKKVLVRNKEDIMETVSNSLVVHETKLKVELTEYLEQHEFVFDAVLKEEVSNDELSQAYFLSVYRETVEPIVPMIFQCTKATCFAHDQTGSGKTYTMKPLPLKASRDILRLMHHTYRNQGFQLFVCFFGIYGGKLFDLLTKLLFCWKLFMLEDGKQQVNMVDVETINGLIEKGRATRSTVTTGANEESSRSHAILKLAIKRSVDGTESKPPRGRGADATDNDKQTSLLALKECIRALDNDQGHIPFRGTTSGVKSLSEGRNPKKDLLSSTLNLKELIAQPLSSVLPTASTFEDDINGTWVDQNERDDFDASEDPFEKEKMTWKKNVKPDQYSSSVSEDKNPLRSDFKHSKSDDDLNTLLQEEEDLVNAHRKQVETMNIVNEEVNLLVEADRPGKQQDGYIYRLNAIFSQKADDVVQLQTQFAHFEKLYRSITF